MKYLKYNMLITASVTLCIIALITTATKATISFDAYWHIATGADFLKFGDSPFIDHFSFTHFGETIKSNPVIFQMAIAMFTSAFGFDEGAVLFKCTVYCCFLLALYFFYKTNNIHTLAVLATLPFIVFFMLQRGTFIRPELISNIFLIISLILYFNTRREFTSKNLVMISILLIIWGNYHTPIFGYIIIFGLFVDIAILKLRQRENFSWKFYFFWAAIIFLTGFVNTELNHFLFSQLDFSNDWKFFIAEYLPLSRYYSTSFRVVFFSASILLMLLLFRKQQYGMLIITALLVSQTWNIVRLLSFTGIVISCIYSLMINDIIHNFASKNSIDQRSKTVKHTIISLLAFVALLGHVYLGYTTYLTQQRKSHDEVFLPFGVVEYLKEYRSPGNIFNLYHFGGFLDYQLPRGFKTYIDGRSNILFPGSFYRRYLDALHNPLILAEEIEKYKINYAILENTPQRYELIANSGLMSLDYIDPYFFLAKRGTVNFPVSGSILMQPACWEFEMTPALRAEIRKGKDLLPISSLREIMIKLEKYQATDDKNEFFQNELDNNPAFDVTGRTIAYLALQQGFFKHSILLFNKIKNKLSIDMMAITIGLIKQQQYKDAYTILQSSFLPLSFMQKLTPSERETILAIFKVLRDTNEIEMDKPLLDALKNVEVVNGGALEKKLCTTRTLSRSSLLTTLEYLKDLDDKQVREP